MSPSSTETLADWTRVSLLMAEYIERKKHMASTVGLQAALDRLGPERVARGAMAFEDSNPRGWEGCFMARVYGEKHAFAGEAMKAGGPFTKVAAGILRVPLGDVYELMAWFDNHLTSFKREVEAWQQRYATALTRLLAEGTVPPPKPDPVEEFLETVATGEPIEEQVPALV